MRIRFLGLAAALALTASSVFGQAVPAGMPKSGVLRGTDIYSSVVSGVFQGEVTGNLSGATQFASSDFAGKNLEDDFPNTHWQIYVLSGSNVSDGSLLDVTDFVGSTGTFTTASADGNWAAGDDFLLIFVGPSSLTELEAVGSICFPGRVTTGNDDNILACEAWIGLGNDRVNDGYYLEVTYHPTTAPRREIRDITDFVSSTGTVTVSPAFSDTVDVGDILTIWHSSAIEARLPGRLVYEGAASVTALGTPTDSFYVESLIGFGDDYFSEGRYYAHVINTTDGAAPIGEYLRVTDYGSNTGLFLVATGGGAAQLGFSANITAEDQISIVHESIYAASRGTPESGMRARVSNNTLNSTSVIVCEELVTSNADSALEGNYIEVVFDAAGGGAAPQGERSKIIAFNSAQGVMTILPALTVACAAGDIIRIYPGESDDVLWGAGGVRGTVTGAKMAANVSIAEGMLFLQSTVDTFRSEAHSTTGLATFPAGVFHANGASMAENAAWQSDTLRKIGVSTDSTLFYLHSTTGAPAVTGAFPVAGLSINERIQFLADSLRKVAVNSDSTLFYLHSTTGAPVATGLFPAAGTSIAERIGFIADSLRKVAVSTDSTLFYLHSTTGMPAATGAFPAAGLSLNERIQFIADSLRKVAVSTDSALAYIHSATGMPDATGAFHAAGNSINERINFIQDSLRLIHPFIADMDGDLDDIDTTADNAVASLLIIQTEVDTEIDTIFNYLYGTTGAPEEAGLFHAGGTSFGERINFIQDSLRLIHPFMADLESDADTIEARILNVNTQVDLIPALRDSLEDANDALQALIGVTVGFLEQNLWRPLPEVIVNFAAAGAWEEAATTHELYNVTGDVEMEITADCSTSVTVTSADSIFFIHELGAASYRVLGTDINAGEGLFLGVEASTGAAVIPTAAILDGGGGIWRITSFGGGDIGFDIDDNDFTGGIIVVSGRYRARNTGGSVVAGAGGGL